MDNIPEREQPEPKERITSLGKDFSLFDPKYVNPLWNEDGKYSSKITINIEGNLKIPFYIGTRKIAPQSKRGYFFLPFSPEEEAYPVDITDFNIQHRLVKLDILEKELEKPIDLSKNPFMLLIESDYNLKASSNKESVSGDDNLDVPQETVEWLNRLRLLLITPKTRLEGKLWSRRLKEGSLIFYKYYPVDTGPMATSPDEDINSLYKRYLQEGLSLAIPDDPEKLSQIRARFVLVEEQPREQ